MTFERMQRRKGKDVCPLLKDICDEVLVEVVKNSLTRSGYYYVHGMTTLAKRSMNLI